VGCSIGAGEAISASCDITIAAEDAIFGVRGFTALPLGFSCYVGAWPAGSHITRAGHMRPERSGLDMAKIGAVTRAVPIDKLEEEVQKWIDALLLLPADSLALQKELPQNPDKFDPEIVVLNDDSENEEEERKKQESERSKQSNRHRIREIFKRLENKMEVKEDNKGGEDYIYKN